MTYGGAIMGVSDSMLHSQRQVAAAVAAPGVGTGGQNLDMALIMADGGPKGRADPAYDAHKLPIGEWAFAVLGGPYGNCVDELYGAVCQEKDEEGKESLEVLLRTGGCVCVELLAAGVEGA